MTTKQRTTALTSIGITFAGTVLAFILYQGWAWTKNVDISFASVAVAQATTDARIQAVEGAVVALEPLPKNLKALETKVDIWNTQRERDRTEQREMNKAITDSLKEISGSVKVIKERTKD